MKKHKSNSVWMRVLTAVVAVLMVTGTAMAGKVQLPEGQEVKVKFPAQTAITSGVLEEGAVLVIELAEPIQIGGVTIVEAGATGTAKVSKVKKAGRGGSPGMIEVTFVDLQPKGDFKSPDGSVIELSQSVESKGKGKKTMSYLFIAGLFIKGGQGEITPDSVYTAKIAKSIMLESE